MEKLKDVIVGLVGVTNVCFVLLLLLLSGGTIAIGSSHCIFKRMFYWYELLN